MSILSKLWDKLKRSKKYRDAFVASHVKTGLPFQIKALRKERNLAQTDLAKLSGISQASVSRSEDPDYGVFSTNTLLSIAAGLDVAFIARFVPFTELAKWTTDLSNESLVVPSFDDEVQETERKTEEAIIFWHGHDYSRASTMNMNPSAIRIVASQAEAAQVGAQKKGPGREHVARMGYFSPPAAASNNTKPYETAGGLG